MYIHVQIVVHTFIYTKQMNVQFVISYLVYFIKVVQKMRKDHKSKHSRKE